VVLPLVGQYEVHVPQRQRGQRRLGLGLDQLAAQGGVLQALDGGDGEGDGHRGEGGDPGAAADRAGRRREVGLRERRALEQRLGVRDQHQRGVGQPQPAAGLLEQRDAGLALERLQLLRHGGRRVAESIGGGGDRAAGGELAEDSEAADVEHGYES